MANEIKKLDSELTEAELKKLGSAEANMWTITPPGGTAMSLDDHHKAHTHTQLSHAEKQRIFNDGMARDQAEREQAHKDFHGEDLPAGADDADDSGDDSDADG